MIRECRIKQHTIGSGRPKLCVPLVGRTAGEIMNQANQIKMSQRSSAIDMVELRGDYLDCLSDFEQLKKLLQDIARCLPEQVLLFTVRSQSEGGEALSPSTPEIAEINQYVIEQQLADLVDIELFSGESSARLLIELAKKKNVKIIMSNHDFKTTPEAETIVTRLCRMQELGADIVKIAVMPENRIQVAELLRATAIMREQYAEVPVVTMSMGKLGAISRISGQIFGSAITFASFAEASAPGQIPVSDMEQMLTLIETYCC